MVKKGGWLKIALLVLVLALCFLLVYFIHLAYPYGMVEPESATLVAAEPYPFPLHNDEWAHLAMGLAIAEEKKLNFNPYLNTPITDREVGFHLVLASIFMIPKINPVLAYQFFAPIMLVINSLLLFFLVYKLTKNYWIGLFAIFFFAAIKSNTNLLGNWFFTPITFSLALMFTYFYFFTKALEAKSKPLLWFGLSALLFVIMLFVYPLAAVLAAVISFVYALTKINFIKKNWKLILFFGVLCAALAWFFIRQYFWAGTLSGTFNKFFSELVFKKGWTSLEHTYSLLSIYGLIPLILAAIGVIYLLLKKKSWLFLIWPALLLLNLLLFILFQISLFLPYQRNLFYLLVGLAPLSAFGLCWLSEMLFINSKKYVFKKKKYGSLPAVLLVLLVLLLTFSNYYKVEPAEFSLQRVITVPEYNALLWLKENYSLYQVVLAKPFLSATVYPVSQDRVVGMMPSSLEGGNYEQAYDFFILGCEQKQKIIEDENVSFVISNDEISCSFLGKIYQDDGIIIYLAG